MEYLGFVNLTPFAAEQLLLADEQGGDVLTFVVKGTYALPAAPGTPVTIGDEQVPVQLAPEYYDDPETGSVKYDSDAVPVKLATDVVLVGNAWAPRGRAATVDVRLRVGNTASVVRVFGDRHWSRIVSRWTASDPEPFETIPLVYERAFGGWDRSHGDASKHEYEPRNPSGVGFLARSGTPRDGAPLPNLENPSALIGRPQDKPPPAGFGFIGPHWRPRIRYGGTYDAAWQQSRMPLLPVDFDRRFYNAAHPALTVPGFLFGGEPVEIENASRHGPLRFPLPAERPQATVKQKDGNLTRLPLTLDTVVIDTDAARLLLVWRGSVAMHRKVHTVLWTKTELPRAA